MRLALAALGLFAACQTSSPPAGPPEDPDHPRMPVAEKTRAVDICEAYVARLCACAKSDATLAERCELAKGQPDAIRLYMSYLQGVYVLPDGGERKGQLSEKDRRMTEAAVRKAVAVCVEGDSRLDPRTCPRSGPPP